MVSSCTRGNAHLGVLDSTPVPEYGHGFAGVGELGKLSFALAYAGGAEYMRLPDNRKALTLREALLKWSVMERCILNAGALEIL